MSRDMRNRTYFRKIARSRAVDPPERRNGACTVMHVSRVGGRGARGGALCAADSKIFIIFLLVTICEVGSFGTLFI
jgi:hypothetical protein